MENATKALLIAASILIAIVILSAVIIAYGNINSYYQAKDKNLSDEQLAEFNNQYTVYNRDDVTGFELVGLINKMIDFNESRIQEGYSKMSITINLNTSAYGGGLFTTEKIEYTDGGRTNKLKDAIKGMQDLEKDYTATALTRLEANIDNLKEYNSAVAPDREKTIADVLGKGYTKLPQTGYKNKLSRETLLKYRDYLTFKRAEFKCIGEEDKTGVTYDNFGQITSLSFEQQ